MLISGLGTSLFTLIGSDFKRQPIAICLSDLEAFVSQGRLRVQRRSRNRWKELHRTRGMFRS